MMRKRGRGAIIAVFLVAIVVFGVIWESWNLVSTAFEPPAATQAQAVPLTIQPGESASQIADDLYNKGLIRSPLAFIVWARVKGLDKTLQAGVYKIQPGMSIDGIIAKLQNGEPDARNILVFEGMRLEEIARQGNKAGLSAFNEHDFLNWTRHPDTFPDAANYPILKGKKSMEGLLFPDTYVIPVNYNTKQIVDLMLDEMTKVLQDNNFVAQAQKHQLDEYHLLMLASIVQREAGNVLQMPLISGIYWNRIFKPSQETRGLMEADPTVQYAYETDNPPSAQSRYWAPLKDSGGNVDPGSPWNTYQVVGWPPTPISSPGMKALLAAASPQQTSCYFFLSKKNGDLVCANTYAEFQQLEAKYLN
ncbi:MAG TPA: endolytic transglycosylase MltG [Ktedonobacteraceae bacterium]